MDPMIEEALANGEISLEDADALVTFEEFLLAAGHPPPHHNDALIQKVLDNPEWREYLGIAPQVPSKKGQEL